jgi:hypothetical protein
LKISTSIYLPRRGERGGEKERDGRRYRFIERIGS